ncbi:MAG: MFS transporter [Deltaproteobacteria bacterium]|nr:MFS transporter [Deltaproteobacteria bacterium]
MTGRVRPVQILVVLAFVNMISYAARNALFAVYPDLVERYHIGDSELGLLQTLFMIPHAAATLGFGWAGDRYDRRRVIAFGLGLASVSAVIGVVGESYVGLAVSRALVGFGTAAVVPVANSILGQIFDGPKKASRMAIFNLGLFVGGVVGFGAGAALGFPVVVIALALPGIALSLLMLGLRIPAHAAQPAQAIVVTGTSARAPGFAAAVAGFLADASVLLRIRTLRWLIASTTVMAFSAGGYNAWLKEFLVREKGMSDAEATSLLALALCGGLSGILVGGRISDWLSTKSSAGRLWTIVIGMTLTAPCATAAIMMPAGVALKVIGVATLFFISWYHAPMAATVDDLAPPRLTVAAQGLVIFTMHMIGTAPSSWVIGAISEQTGSIATALWVPTVGLILAAICMGMATRTFARDRGAARGDSL